LARRSAHEHAPQGISARHRPFDLALDNGSLAQRRSCTAHFKFNIRD
jgi:hypothetical protein